MLLLALAMDNTKGPIHCHGDRASTPTARCSRSSCSPSPLSAPPRSGIGAWSSTFLKSPSIEHVSGWFSSHPGKFVASVEEMGLSQPISSPAPILSIFADLSRPKRPPSPRLQYPTIPISQYPKTIRAAMISPRFGKSRDSAPDSVSLLPSPRVKPASLKPPRRRTHLHVRKIAGRCDLLRSRDSRSGDLSATVRRRRLGNSGWRWRDRGSTRG
jgi:hypothetical protein